MSKIYFHQTAERRILAIEDGHRLGTAKDCEHVLQAESLAPHHCIITFKNGNVFVEALSGLRSTYLNGLKLVVDRKYIIRPGDRVKLGPFEFMVAESEQRLTPAPAVHDAFEEEGAGLSLDSPEGETTQQEDPLILMKKARKIVVELQETKKQLEAKARELNELQQRQVDLKDEIHELEDFVGEHIGLSPGEIEREIEAQSGDCEILDQQIAHNRRVLAELESKREELHNAILERKAIVEKLHLLNELEGQRAHTLHTIEVLKKLNLEEKIARLNEVIKEEQGRYKDLHDEHSLTPVKKQRHG